MPRLRQNGQEKTAPAPTRWVGGDNNRLREAGYLFFLDYLKTVKV
jgi:hypothetical protein